VLKRFVFAMDIGKEMLSSLRELELGREVDDRRRSGLD